MLVGYDGVLQQAELTIGDPHEERDRCQVVLETFVIFWVLVKLRIIEVLRSQWLWLVCLLQLAFGQAVIFRTFSFMETLLTTHPHGVDTDIEGLLVEEECLLRKLEPDSDDVTKLEQTLDQVRFDSHKFHKVAQFICLRASKCRDALLV